MSRQISELERSLGITLFERSVRGPSLTDAGRDLLDQVGAMGDAVTLTRWPPRFNRSRSRAMSR
ncbi:MAG: LysR family transcriptional regulator [Pseudomonadota bacterium]